MLPNLLATTVILLLVTMSDILVINIILLPRSGGNHLLIYSRVCLTTCTYSTPDLPVAHTIRELALCRDDNSTFLLTSVEISQIIEYLCTILVLETIANQEIYS